MWGTAGGGSVERGCCALCRRPKVSHIGLCVPMGVQCPICSPYRVGDGGWERAHELEFPGSEATTSRVCLVPWLLIKNLLVAGDQGFRIKDSKQGKVTPALGPHAAPARGLRHAAKLVSLLTHSCRTCFPEFEVFSGTWDMLNQPQDCWRAGMLLCSM